MENITNKIPKLHNKYFEDFNLNSCLNQLIDSVNYNLNETYVTNDLKELLTYQLNQLKKIKAYVSNSIRFNHLYLQKSIDDLHNRDNSLTEISIKFVYKAVEKGKENAGFLVVNLVKN
jgi:uncharacterized SAM-dependent methyltransferase